MTNYVLIKEYRPPAMLCCEKNRCQGGADIQVFGEGGRTGGDRFDYCPACKGVDVCLAGKWKPYERLPDLYRCIIVAARLGV